MAKTLIALVFGTIIVVAADPAIAGGSKLAVLEDAKRSEFLATLEQVAQWQKPPFHVKIFKSYEGGECDGSPETCPRVHLYISASTFDEAPDVAVFLLPSAYAWDFVRWGDPPAGESSNDHMVAFLKRKILGPDVRTSWFAEELVRIEVNPWGGTLTTIEESPRDSRGAEDAQSKNH